MKVMPPPQCNPLKGAISKKAFKAEVETWAKRIGVRPREIYIRPMTKKWGSCSSNGRLMFDIELLRQQADFRKRVIVEELLHLQVPSHGGLLRSFIRAYLNNYRDD